MIGTESHDQESLDRPRPPGDRAPAIGRGRSWLDRPRPPGDRAPAIGRGRSWLDLTDEELAALALAADPDTPVDDDAVSLWELTGSRAVGPLPEWYMPAAAGGRHLSGWRRVPPLLVVASLLVINGYGLCNTYGQLGLS